MKVSDNSDRAITNFALMLQAVEHIPEFYQHYVKLFESLFEFLTSNDLFSDSAQTLTKEEFRTCVLRYSHLKPRGALLFRPPLNAYSKWLAANDRVDKPISLRSLQNGLKKVGEP